LVKSFDLAVVDVPYGIGEDGASNHSRNQLAQATKYTPKSWDSKAPDKQYFDELMRVSKNQIVWGAACTKPLLCVVAVIYRKC